MPRSKNRVRQFLLAGITAATLALSACAATSSPASKTQATATDSLTVFAAASLQIPFDQLRTEFQAQHRDLDFPPITYDGSATLVTQIKNGATVDVFASADSANMDKLADEVTGRTEFAKNTLQIAVHPDNPHGVTALADLAQPQLVLVLCAAEVPCGAASQRALEAARVEVQPASEEQNVTSVLTKVRTGEADAGLVYATDVQGSEGAVIGIDFPEAASAVNKYPIAVLNSSKSPAIATDFIEFITSARGQKILTEAGFQAQR